ncbi:MAG: FHA domain-containing protein [Chloroflexi bacterium]|jgi:pSer/pThr/pTyr-binding forkhead associated (FHA) protein|nr:FHA domain-containing protein [Chloroflexota bacterium]MBT3668838.1 FHA domain-containing protein [Chloroflexota bacterium]MBT4004232.1 FHA domain-containing protein [Chloroflexota bacterium]MBT4306552.1 FHA domain-containing protein [Chloroflexota bacterium]MBT4533936.1 FHA domain-containing protein [Chloroflexota bacterium]
MQQNHEELSVLIAQTGPLEGQQWTIHDNLIIGRDPQLEIAIVTPDKQVSRHHAKLTLVEEGILLEDMGSKNGTHLNGELITEPTLLKDGDTMQIAMAQQFVFLSSDSTVPLQSGQISPIYPKKTRLSIDQRARRVWILDKEVEPPLSVAQYAMLELLHSNNGEVVSRRTLIETIWGEENSYEVSNQALDALVRRLRDRLSEIDPYEFIITVRGHGLRLDNP